MSKPAEKTDEFEDELNRIAIIKTKNVSFNSISKHKKIRRKNLSVNAISMLFDFCPWLLLDRIEFSPIIALKSRFSCLFYRSKEMKINGRKIERAAPSKHAYFILLKWFESSFNKITLWNWRLLKIVSRFINYNLRQSFTPTFFLTCNI